MANFKGTIGKWSINKHSSTTVECNGRSIATTGGYSDNKNMDKVCEENDANAKLIASASEMLEKLIEIEKWLENHEEWWIDCPNKGGFDQESIQSLIKKATE